MGIFPLDMPEIPDKEPQILSPPPRISVTDKTSSAKPATDPVSILGICREGVRRNRIPALFLQAFAGGILLLYFFVPGARSVFVTIETFKAQSGPGFAMGSTALFGGLLPWLVLRARGKFKTSNALGHLLFLIVFWAVQGMIVDALYTFQDHLFGSGRDWSTLLTKLLVDQGPFNLLYATPNTLLFYGWRNADFSWRRFWRQLDRRSLLHRYITIQVSGWVTWVPAVLMIYSLPPDLQIPLFNLVLCFFSLLLAFVSRH